MKGEKLALTIVLQTTGQIVEPILEPKEIACGGREASGPLAERHF
jgi:hypothetical protein